MKSKCVTLYTNHQPDIDEIYLCTNDLYEAKH